MKKLKVLFAAAEVAPFAKTGGLGEVVGTLPKALKAAGLDVRVILPKYSNIPQQYTEKMNFITSIKVPVGKGRQYCGLLKLEYEGLICYFIDNEFYFKRAGMYGYGDDAERFSFFCRAVLEALPELDFIPNIIHCHDWQTGLISVYLKSFYRSYLPNVRTVFTIHNLKYQGIFPYEVLHDVLGLNEEHFTIDGLEFYGAVNFMKGGFNYADVITTVSPNYAREIMTPEYGEGLHGLLQKRSENLHGILNGLDYNEYDPASDKNIYANYNMKRTAKKKINKSKLQRRLQLPAQKNVPLMAVVSRLVPQKGMYLIEQVWEEILAQEVQLVVLGTGEYYYEQFFKEMAHRYPEQVSVNIKFDGELAHKIYAGADMLIMPSLFEPCGLSQLIALRYGTIPIVRHTGGLVDTIQPFDELNGTGNGFCFTHFDGGKLLKAVKKALTVYQQKQKHAWRRLMKNAMKYDYSWDKSAEKYIQLYNQLGELA